jgi:SRSO17 transposase
VTLSIANHHASLPIAYRLYLPREWADDKARRQKAHVPASIRFKTKPQSALDQIRAALLASVPPGVVLMDASYGNNGKLRQTSRDWGSATWPPFSRPPKCARCARTIRSRRASASKNWRSAGNRRRLGPDLDQAALDRDLRRLLAERGVFPEFIAVEFECVM